MTDHSFITRHAETLCPNCQYSINASADPKTGAVPKPGDLSVCINCAACLRYSDDELHLRMMTPGEIDELSPEERNDLFRHVVVVLTLNSMKKRIPD